MEPKILDEQNGIIRCDGIIGTLTTDGSSPKHNNRIIEPCIAAQRGREAKILTSKRTEYGKKIRKQYENGEISEQRKNIQQLEPRADSLTNALTTAQKDNLLIENPTLKGNVRIRKLTPKECWRLMAFSDEDFDKAKAAGVSNSQLYKQAGNSIVVKVLEAIFGEMV